MKIFRDYLMPWWQVGLLKAYVFVVGLLVGVYFTDVVAQYTKVLWVIFIVLLVYFAYQMFTNGFKEPNSVPQIGE